MIKINKKELIISILIIIFFFLCLNLFALWLVNGMVEEAKEREKRAEKWANMCLEVP